MYGQGNYPPQFRPPPFQLAQPNLPPPPPPPFQQSQPNQPPPSSFHQAPPGQQPPPILHNPHHSLTHQAPPGPPPPQYQQNVAQPQQAGPSYLHPPPQPFLPPPPPPPIQANPPMPPLYSQHNASYSHHHVQPMPPPRMFPLPPPPPRSQGQVLYRTPAPPPYGIQHLPAAPPPPPPSGFVPITPSPYAPYGQLTAEICPPSLPPPPPPPPPPSSPPPLPPSPPPPISPTMEVIGVPMAPSPGLPTQDTADAAVAPVVSESEVYENEGPIVKEEALMDLSTSPPKPADEEMVQNMEILCQSIANSGPDTESLACKNEAGNPKFAFLFGGEPGSDAAIGHEYFQWMKRKYFSEKDVHEQNVSLIDSDMDMEDDVSRADAEKIIDESSKRSTCENIFVGSEVLAAKNSPATFHEGEEDKASAFIEDVSPVRVSPDAAEELSENNLLGSVKLPTEDLSMVKVSSTPVRGGALEAPRVYVKDGSPFRLIQDYASDYSEEDDKENADMNADRPSAAGSPVKHEKMESPPSFRAIDGHGEEIRSNIHNDAAQISLLTTAKDREYSGSLPHEATCQYVTSLASVDHTKEVRNFQDDDKCDDKIVTCDSIQKNETLDGVNMNAEDLTGKHQLAGDTNQDSVKLDVDEFGRLVRKGASDSESDEMQYSGRHAKRGRNTSRSRSPQESRRRHRSRSPRRRDKRSRSRSRSPKRTRSKSPPAYRRMTVSSRRDHDRDRDRNQPPECLNFNRGRCFRGSSCRFLHRDFTQHMSRNQDYHDAPRDSADYDKHDTSPSFSLDKSAETEMDIEQINDAPSNDAASNDAKSAEIHTPSEQSGAVIWSVSAGEMAERDEPDDMSIGKNDVRELHTTEHVIPEGKPPMEKSQDELRPRSPIEEDTMQPPLQLSHSPQADSVLVQSSSAASSHPQITTPTKISGLKEPEGPQCSPGLEPHPLPSPTALPPAIAQTSSNQSSLIQSYTHDPPNLNPSLPLNEFPAPKFSGPDANFQMSQQVPPGPPGPPPYHFPSDNPSTHFAPHLRPVHPLSAGYQTQPAPSNHFSHLHSQSLPPPNPGWPNILPAPSFLAMPPRHDLNPMMGPYPPGEMTRPPLVGDFHSQPFRPADSSHQPPFHMNEFRRMPLPHDHPFGREDRFIHPHLREGPQIMPNSQRDYHLQNRPFLHEEARIPLSGQGFSSMSSLSQGGEVHGHPLSLPREIIPDSLHTFPREHVNLRPFHREEFSSFAVKDMPYSHRPPLNVTQHPVSINYPPNLSTSGLLESTLRRYPSSFLDNKPSHYNPFASTFEQVPTSSKFVSGVSGREYDMHTSKYDSSFSSGHVSAGVPESRLKASPPDLKRAGEHILPRAGQHAEENSAAVKSDSQKLLAKNPAGDAYDPLFDSIEPSPKKLDQVGGSNAVVNDIDETSKIGDVHKPAYLEDSKKKGSTGSEHKLEVDEIGEVATDAGAGAVENASPQPLDERDWSPDLPLDMGNAAAGEIEIDQVQSPGKSKKSKDSRSMKLFKVALADFVKEVLKPSWRQGNMSKEAFKTIVKKTVDKVSGAMPSHQIPKSQAKINQYVESSQRKLTKLVMGYVDKYVKA